MSDPGVSCICLTYGRTWLLAEAIESFIRQRTNLYRELIIVNDMPQVTLSLALLDMPENAMIRIINMPERMESLNDKFDHGVSLAQYDTILMWDDDDISLPNRIEDSNVIWDEDADYIAFTHHYSYSVGKPIELIPRGIHGGDVFTKKCYESVNGSQGDGHNDQNFVAKVKAHRDYREADNSDEPQYIYRWGGITGHTSCYSTDLKTCMQRFHDDVVNDKRFKSGHLLIAPAWAEDYEAIALKEDA